MIDNIKKMELLQKAAEISETATKLMEVEDLHAAPHNLSELDHHLEQTIKYLKRIIQDNNA